MSEVIQGMLLAFLQILLFPRKVFYALFPAHVEEAVTKMFKKSGIEIGGSASCDIQVLDPRFYSQVALYRSIGLGDSFVNGYWTANNLAEFFNQCSIAIKNRPKRSGGFFSNFTYGRLMYILSYKMFNLQTKLKAWEVGEKHYDIGNDLYELMLDPTMNYTCAYFKDAKTLDQAQLNKMELLAQKLKLKPGMRVLDLGCGFGSLAKYLAENHGVEVVGCTISKEQAKWGMDNCKGLPVDIRLIDYRDMDKEGFFDRVVSVGMMEHVGEANYPSFFEIAANCLNEDGLFVCHTMGINHPTVSTVDAWTDRYIFPNAVLPYHTQITKHIDGVFIIEDWHNIGFDYSRTLEGWNENFQKNWPKIQHKFGQKFHKMWTYYLYCTAAAFRQRNIQLWQIVLSKNGIKGGYQSVR